MKKLISMLLITTVFLMSGCQLVEKKSKSNKDKKKDKVEKVKDDDDEDSLTIYKEKDMPKLAGEVTDDLHTIVCDDDFIEAFGFNRGELIKELQDVEIDKSEDVYVVKIDVDGLEKYMKEMDGDNIEITDAVYEVFRDNMDMLFANASISNIGVDYFSIISSLKHSKSFVASDIEDQVWVIPTNDENVAMIVYFFSTGDNIITVRASYMYFRFGIEDYVEIFEEYFDVEQKSVKW